jgi:hypothetical protein
MSLKPTSLNFQTMGGVLSCEEWARRAIGLEKRSGKEGFSNYSSGEWRNYWNYRGINNEYPTLTKIEFVDEMSHFRQKLAQEILVKGREVDKMIMRLDRMEEEIKLVIAQEEIEKG